MGGYERREHLGFDPNEAAFTKHGGWLRTGDRGWFDSHRRLHLSGRFKEVINRAGEKISPEEAARIAAAVGQAVPPEGA